MTIDNDHDKIILLHKKADAQFVLKNIVHIKLLRGNWKRGTIEEVREEFLILNERLEGRVPLFFQEIDNIEKFHEVER